MSSTKYGIQQNVPSIGTNLLGKYKIYIQGRYFGSICNHTNLLN